MSVLARRRTQVPLRLLADAELVRSLLLARVSRGRRAAKRHRAQFYRDMWNAAAGDVGATVNPAGGGALEIDLGATSIRVRETRCSIDGPEVLSRAGDKAGVYRLLGDLGLPLPAHAVFSLTTMDRARRFLADTPGHCVVKPARDTAGGRGVATGLQTPRDLGRAASAAAAQGARAVAGASGGLLGRLWRMHRLTRDVPLLIEEQVPGENYRLLYLDGVLLDAVRRGSPTVAGDGRTRISALIDRLNDERLRAGGQRGQWLVSRDLDLERTLASQGLSASSVPAAGTLVRLKTVVNENDPQNNHPARCDLCDNVVEQCARAAAAVGARLAGVDIITRDPGVPLAESGGRILEVNTTPGFSIHLNGQPGAVNPATLLLRHLSGPLTADSRS